MPQRPSPPEDLARWSSVDRYLGSAVGDSDPTLEAALRTSERAGLPPIQVSPLQGKLLHLLVRAIGARRILEVGTLGGYSTIWLARALPRDGRLVTLELDPHHAEVARANLERAGVADLVDVRVGPASESLSGLAEQHAPPFDLVFIDADKTGYPEYLDWAVRLSHPGTLIVADNVVRRGDVADPASTDPNVQGVRRMMDRIAHDPGLCATVVQTVGPKGHDGFALVFVVGGVGPWEEHPPPPVPGTARTAPGPAAGSAS